MKLSKAQLEVLSLMNSGWELAEGHHSRAWLQAGGAGRGGEIKRVSRATTYALYRAQAIKAGRQGPGLSQCYEITPAGLAALEAEGGR